MSAQARYSKDRPVGYGTSRLKSRVCVNTWCALIKLMHYDETEKMTHDSQIVRAKGNLKLRQGGPATARDWSSPSAAASAALDLTRSQC